MGIHWLVIITIVVVFLQAKIYTKWGLKNISYTRFFSTDAVFEGEEVYMVEKVSNMKLLPIPWLRLESRIDASLKFQKQFDIDVKYGQYHKSLFSLAPYGQITRRHRVQCVKRGCYYLNSAVISCGDAFESDEVHKQIELSASLLVYPKPIPINEVPLPTHNWMGDIIVRRWIVEDPFMISGAREYCYGDPLNRVNWKATARVGRLQVHNMEHTSDPHLMIYVNIDAEEELWGRLAELNTIEKGITYAASIAQHYISKGVDTGFGCNGYMIDQPKQPVRIHPKRGRQHLMGLLEGMAKLVTAQSVPFSRFLDDDIAKGVTDMDFLFITTYVSKEMEKQIKSLTKLGNSIKVIELKNSGVVEEEGKYEN